MTAITTTLRNGGLDEIIAMLTEQQGRKIDQIVEASQLRLKDGQLIATRLDPKIDLDGVTPNDGRYAPTEIFDEGLAERLGIPLPYLRRLRAERIDLLDANVNGLLHGKQVKRAGDVVETVFPGDPRLHTLRLFRGADNGPGIARALLSNRYARLDNLDGLMAMLDGVTAAGIDPATLTFDRCDLSDRRMYVKVSAPEIRALAPELLRGYRNPFARPEIAERRVHGRNVEEWRRIAAAEGKGYSEEEGGEPIVFAGFVFSNSEVGSGRWSLSPQIVVRICKNGLTFTDDAFGRTHLGAALEQGAIEWSADTQDKNLALVTAQTRDAVKKYLDAGYVAAKVAQLEQTAGAPVDRPEETIKALSTKLRFSPEAAAGILSHFIVGGQITAGGIMQAVTSYSQTVGDADEAFDMERKAVQAMELAAVRR